MYWILWLSLLKSSGKNKYLVDYSMNQVRPVVYMNIISVRFSAQEKDPRKM